MTAAAWFLAAWTGAVMATTDESVFDLGFGEAPDAALQATLEEIDERIGAALGVPAEDRRAGVVDVTGRRFALVRGDDVMYGASVPKIGILLGWFDAEPARATSLDAATRRELELMIKRSDNALAAKYSRLVGLERLAALYTSARYGLYDAAYGGGLWSGKHYGQAAPRTGDPVNDLSHAATARQVLRYYLMMEQGRLVSPEVSAEMRSIFAAPRLDFHEEGFVRGLRHRRAGVLRKNGRWEDWHLDSARVERDGRVYLVVGLVHHPEGREYLVRLATAVDDALGGTADGLPVHQFRDQPSPGVAAPLLEGAALSFDRFFDEALVSWNVDVADDDGFVVEVRVGRRADDSWGPWLGIGSWGSRRPDHDAPLAFDGGRIDVDVFRSDERWDRLQWRVLATRRAVVRRVSVTVSDRSGLPTERSEPPPVAFVAPALPFRLDVPFRSQQDEAPAIRRKICSPASVAMVLAHHGRVRSTAEVAALLKDPDHGIYGNWARAVQGAWTAGVPGALRRFSDWNEVRDTLQSGRPLVVSIATEAGELCGAPYERTSGHLLVLCGFDAAGDVAVNDPAATTAAEGMVVYRRDELEQVWMRRGGTAYVFDPP